MLFFHNYSQASYISSNASEGTRKVPFQYKLKTVNQALKLLDISALTEKEAKNTLKVSRMICDVQQNILELLGHEPPPEDLGEKVISQFVSEFEEKSTENQYRILTFNA
jgi:hypothetical protein